MLAHYNAFSAMKVGHNNKVAPNSVYLTDDWEKGSLKQQDIEGGSSDGSQDIFF